MFTDYAKVGINFELTLILVLIFQKNFVILQPYYNIRYKNDEKKQDSRD